MDTPKRKRREHASRWEVIYVCHTTLYPSFLFFLVFPIFGISPVLFIFVILIACIPRVVPVPLAVTPGEVQERAHDPPHGKEQPIRSQAEGDTQPISQGLLREVPP